MSLFDFFRKARPPAPPPVSGSAPFQDFHRNFVANPSDLEQIRHGLDLRVFDRLTPDERAEAERLLLERLAGGGDSRAAVGLGVLKSQAAVAPLRRAIALQPGKGAMASAAYAEALWRINRDPQAIEAVSTLAADPRVHESARVDAVVALAGMPSPQAAQAMETLLGSDAAYLVRYHAFKGLLKLHGYSAREADDLTGALAPHLAGAHARPAARETVQARLVELLAGRALAAEGSV